MTMPGSPFEAWSTDEPPAGFADRVAAAVVRDRVARARVGLVRVRISLAVAACMLVAAGAFAWVSSPQRVARSTAPEAARVERADPVPSSLAVGPAPSSTAPPADKSTRPARAVASVRVADAAAPAVVRVPNVPAPSCVCNAFACDCGPE